MEPVFESNLKDRMLKGSKTCFIRPIRLTPPGKRFEAFGVMFEVDKVEQLTLDEAFHNYYSKAGYESYEELWEVWDSLHHGKYRPTWKCFVHWFRRI